MSLCIRTGGCNIYRGMCSLLIEGSVVSRHPVKEKGETEVQLNVRIRPRARYLSLFKMFRLAPRPQTSTERAPRTVFTGIKLPGCDI
jgi:hypothetical protein